MDIPGWNADITPWQKFIAPRIPKGGTYLEVGVFLGASLVHMGELRPDLDLIAVDPWIAEPGRGWLGPSEYMSIVAEHGDFFLAFLRGMLMHAPDVLRRTKIIRGTAETITLRTPVDLLFIDGAHDKISVRYDLEAFAPLVKKGGIIAGHDYCTTDYPGVPEAVDHYFGKKPNVGCPDGSGWSCWWMEAT